MKNSNFCSTLASLVMSLRSHRALWLLVFIAVLTTKAQAQYSLTMPGDPSKTHIYETSFDEIEHPCLKSGKMSFNAATGEIVLDNVVFENPQSGIDGNFIAFSAPGVTGKSAKIILKGTNKITCKGTEPIQLTMLNCTIIRETAVGYNSKNCVLEINCDNKTGTAIELNRSTLLISNCTVKAYGGYYGIGGNGYDASQKLTTTLSNTVAKGSKGSIANINSLELGTGTSIRRPAGAAFSSTLHGVALDGSLVTDEVIICESDYKDDTTAPVPGDMDINFYAKDNRVYVRWEPATDNVTAQDDLEYKLTYKEKKDGADWITVFDWTKGKKGSYINGLTQGGWYNIDLEVRDEAGNLGYYSWTSFRLPISYGFYVEGTEVTDSNNADIPITSGKAYYDPSVRTLTLTNANIVAYGLDMGIYNSDQPNLIIKPVGNCHITTDYYSLDMYCDTYISGKEGGTLSIESKEKKPVSSGNQAELKLIDCHIESPVFGMYDKTKGSVLSWNGSEVKSVSFAPGGDPYDLYLATRVTKANKNNITSPDIKSGTASYDPDTKTLTLDNVNIVCNDDCIMSKIDGLTVKLVGDNKLLSGSAETIWLIASATFTGDGSLYINGEDADGVELGYNDVTMTIDNTNVRIASENSSAIWGSSSYSNKKMVINHSRVTLYSAGTADTVVGLDDLELVNCDFESGNFFFNPSKKSICDYRIGGYPAGQQNIIIVPTGESEDNIAYAEYTDADKTLTFYYDKQKDLRTGSVCTTRDDWADYDSKVIKVVFDLSFVAYQPTSTSYWFAGFKKLETVEGLNCLTTIKVTDMSHMFEGCKNLTSIDLSLMNTENVTDMVCMFAECSSLTSLDLTHFDTSNVTNMGGMFDGCSSLTMLNVNLFDTRKVTDMSSMFSGCSSLTMLEIQNFRTSAVTNMYQMFSNCKALTEIDLQNFDMSKVTAVGGFFYNCEKLSYISCNKDWSKLTELKPSWSDNVFKNCYMLTGGNGTVYDADHVGLEYARPDLGPEAPGYFTRKLLKGDVNADYVIDVADIASIINVMAGTASYERADVNGDHVVDVADIASVISIMAGN